MAKNPLITDNIRRLITGVYLEHPDWRAQEIRNEVETRWHEKHPRSKPGWPGLSAVQKELTKQRKTDNARPPELRRLDTPWSIGTLAQYEIPPEALPIVMNIYEQKLREEEQHFTIREALWIARLHKLIDDPVVLEPFASAYALRDQIDEILGLSVYTRGFDITVLRHLGKQLTAADIAKFPGIIYPFETNEEEAALRNNMKQEGYEIRTHGEKLLEKDTEELWQQAVQFVEQNVAYLEQIKPEELNEKQARYLKWAQKFLNAEREKRRAHNERSHRKEG